MCCKFLHFKLQEAQAKQEEIIKDMENKIQIKNKTLTVLSKDENMEKLKNLVEKGNERLIQLAEQWNQVQAPLLEEYRTKQNALHAQDVRISNSLTLTWLYLNFRQKFCKMPKN